MKVGELFVELGAKGGDGLEKQLKTTKSTMGEVYSSSLALKAAILGIAYGLQQMMSSSAQAGTDLQNFNSLTGISVKTLQQWQYAARQVGVSNEEVAGSFKSVQSAVSNMLMGKGPIQGFDLVAQKVGLDQNRLRDTEYVLKQLQQFSQQVAPDIGNQVLKGFGVGEGMTAAFRRNAFRPEMLAKAPTYSEGQIKQLDKVNAAWANLETKVKMAFGEFTAKNGLKIVSDLSKITTEVIKLANSLTILADKLRIFELIGKVFGGWDLIFKQLNQNVDTLNSMGSYKSGTTGESGVLSWMKDATINDLNTIKNMFSDSYVAPRYPAPATNKTNNTTINQNLNFQHDGRDAQKTGESVHKAVRDAVRTSPAQNQVN